MGKFTSRTLFASHKLPLRCYLAAIAIFCNQVKGKSALALSRDLNVSYKCAFVLLHKLREAMAEEMKGRTIGGGGKVAEVDGGYFGGYVKPANYRENRRDRRLGRNQNGKRKVVVVVRERDGQSLPAVFRSESHALDFIRRRVAKGTTINVDEAGSWEGLQDRFEVRTINHQEAYSADGACTNWAEEFFSRMRRAEIGRHHHIAGAYLLRYPQEASWREDHRRTSNGDQTYRVAGLAMKRKQSVDFTGRAAAAETEAAARRATEAQILEDAGRLVAAWNERQAKRMPMLFSPTIGCALKARYWFLWVRCPACRTTQAVDLRTLDRHPWSALTGLIPALSCRNCRPHAPFAELVFLSDKSIADELREERARRIFGE